VPDRAFPDELSRWIREQRYQWRGPGAAGDADLAGTRARLASAVAAAESSGRTGWEERFRALEESAVTLQHGGGIGCDFPTLQPRGTSAQSAGTIASGSRRGTMMATLRVDHPDVLEFIDAKRDPLALRYFNLSVQVTDRFLAAVRAKESWRLSHASGLAAAEALPARVIWNRLLDAGHSTSEPGVLFVDTIDRENNLGWREKLTTTNPCGEVPLPPYGACNLGSIKPAKFVRSTFAADASLDVDAIEAHATLATRFLDDVLDVTRFPLPQALRDRIASTGIRNSHLTVVAPAGTISLLAGNTPSGIEPIFEFVGRRRALDRRGEPVEFEVTDAAVRWWRELHGDAAPLPEAFVSAASVDPEAHLLMQAALQPWVDGAISRTIHLPADFPRERYGALFTRARTRIEGLHDLSCRHGARAGDDVERCCTVA